MSADNQIQIEFGIDSIYRGFDRFIEGDYSEIPSTPVFTATTVKGAVRAAQKYISENTVEYGYIFISGIEEEEDIQPIEFVRGKIYCLQIKNYINHDYLEDMCHQIAYLKEKYDISFFIISEDISIIKIPEGFKVERVDE